MDGDRAPASGWHCAAAVLGLEVQGTDLAHLEHQALDIRPAHVRRIRHAGRPVHLLRRHQAFQRRNRHYTPVSGTSFYCNLLLCHSQTLAIETASAAISFACLGTLLLVTHGDLSSMKISGLALFWGVSSAVALAFYTIQPVQLLRENDAANVVDWSMVVGGLGLSLLSKPWNIPGVWDMQAISAAGFIIVFGTLLSFYAYLAAVKCIGPQKDELASLRGTSLGNTGWCNVVKDTVCAGRLAWLTVHSRNAFYLVAQIKCNLT